MKWTMVVAVVLLGAQIASAKAPGKLHMAIITDDVKVEAQIHIGDLVELQFEYPDPEETPELDVSLDVKGAKVVTHIATVAVDTPPDRTGVTIESVFLKAESAGKVTVTIFKVVDGNKTEPKKVTIEVTKKVEVPK